MVKLEPYNYLTNPSVTYFSDANCSGSTDFSQFLNPDDDKQLRFAEISLDEVTSVMLTYDLIVDIFESE